MAPPRTTETAPRGAATARDIVASHLVRRVKKFPNLPLAPLDASALDARDAGLARAIDHAVATRWLTLVALLLSRLDRPWERVQPELQAILLTAAAQLFFLDRVPDHAAVDHAVQWTKTRVRPRAGGFINGVLRSLIRLRGERPSREAPGTEATPGITPGTSPFHSRTLSQDQLPLADGRIITLAEPVFAEDAALCLAQQTSHAEPLVGHWWTTRGEAQTRSLCLHDLVDPPILVTGITPHAQAGGMLEPHEQPGFAVFRGSHEQLLTLLNENSTLRVQDPTSGRAVEATARLSPRLIADLCAGRGTKTVQLAQQHPDAKIIASDADQSRVSALRQRFKDSAQVQVIDRAQWLDFAGQVDLLVLDVPCTNTGVLARRPEARYRFSGASLHEVAGIQRQVLADSLALRSPDGRVLYSTCSIERAENEDQAQWLSRWHRLDREADELTIPAGLPGDSDSRYRDGGYWALCRATA